MERTSVPNIHRQYYCSLSKVAEIFRKDVSTIRRWVYSGKAIVLDGNQYVPQKDHEGFCWRFLVKRINRGTGSPLIEYLTLKDMATRFHKSERTIRNWIKKYPNITFDGEQYIPHKDIGGRCWRFTVKSILSSK